jgi:hypothetical protein
MEKLHDNFCFGPRFLVKGANLLPQNLHFHRDNLNILLKVKGNRMLKLGVGQDSELLRISQHSDPI